MFSFRKWNFKKSEEGEKKSSKVKKAATTATTTLHQHNQKDRNMLLEALASCLVIVLFI